MKYIKIIYLLLILMLIVISFSCSKDAAENETEATYMITFEFYWDETNFPIDFPSNAHFSKLIGWSHQKGHSFFKPGTIASTGIKDMAERGNISPLDAELADMINKGEGLDTVIGSSLGSGTGSITVSLDVDINYPSITLATMVAPSPDWYVAVVDINLLQNGRFVQNKSVQGIVYDAGTDSGVTFISENEVTEPQEPINLFVNPPLGNGIRLNTEFATVTINKKQ